MALRPDDRQWLIYDPDLVEHVLEALTAASLVYMGAWMQQMGSRIPEATLRENTGTVGAILSKIGHARQEIQAGKAPNDVPDSLVRAQHLWDIFARFVSDPSSVPLDVVNDAMDQLAGAIAYLDQRTQETGTNHPRWNSLLVAGQSCKHCGR